METWCSNTLWSALVLNYAVHRVQRIAREGRQRQDPGQGKMPAATLTAAAVLRLTDCVRR